MYNLSFTTNGDNSRPKAYIHYLYFDKDYNYQSGGMAQVSTTTGAFQELSLQFTADREGYVLVYTANQTAEDLDVFIDDLLVEHIESPVIRTDDYYPFGLAFNSSQRTGVLTNKYLYNGKELQTDLNLDWYDYGARMYDPALGRWHVQDAMAEKYFDMSPYNYVLNNPLKFIDPDGNIVTDSTGNIVVTSTGTTTTSGVPLSTQTLQNGNTVETMIVNTYENVYIYADDGTKISALQLQSSEQVTTEYDANGSVVNTATAAPNPNMIDSKADCHGYTFTDNKLWVNNDQVNKILKHDGYAKTTENNAGIVVFKNMGVLHSAKRNANGTYNDNAGIMTTEYNRSLSDASRGFVDVSNPRRTAFYSKGSSNRVSSTSAGTVQGGLRIISNRKDIRDFRKSLRN